MATDDEVWEDSISKWVAELRQERERVYAARKAQRKADKERIQAARLSKKTYANAWRARRGK